jgi:hypothetical protein
MFWTCTRGLLTRGSRWPITVVNMRGWLMRKGNFGSLFQGPA